MTITVTDEMCLAACAAAAKVWAGSARADVFVADFRNELITKQLEAAFALLPPIKLPKDRYKTLGEAATYNDYWEGFSDALDHAKQAIESAGYKWSET